MDEVKKKKSKKRLGEEEKGGDGGIRKGWKEREGAWRGEAGVEGQEESEGQKERRWDKSVGPQGRGGGLISTAVLCVLKAPQVNGGG